MSSHPAGQSHLKDLIASWWNQVSSPIPSHSLKFKSVGETWLGSLTHFMSVGKPDRVKPNLFLPLKWEANFWGLQFILQAPLYFWGFMYFLGLRMYLVQPTFSPPPCTSSAITSTVGGSEHWCWRWRTWRHYDMLALTKNCQSGAQIVKCICLN